MAVESWNRDPPPGFQGLRDDLPITFYYRHLPHWRQDGATYFVTFRLADSLPQSKLRELKALKRDFAAQHGIVGPDWQEVLRHRSASIERELWEAVCRKHMALVEKWLDSGMGSCLLQRPEVGTIVADALHHFAGQKYELGCCVIMPNHVHAVLRPLRPETDPLEKILQSRKGLTAREINAIVDRQGTLWQEESFDRIIRDEEHLYRCIQYIGDNPRRAGLSLADCPRWIAPEWVKLGWTFDDV